MRIYRRDAISNASLLSRIKIMSYSKIRLIFRIIFISLFFLLLLFVFYRNLNPLGLSRVYNYSFSPKINHFINPLLPKERVSQYYFSQTGDWYQTLKGPLVYFSLYPVSPKQQVKITVKYKSEVPEIIFGKVTSAGEELEFRASPFYHSFIQNLTWDYVEENGVYLYQKEKHFTSVQDYLSHYPKNQKNVVYFFADGRMQDSLSLNRLDNPEQEIDYLVTTCKKSAVTNDGWLETSLSFNLNDALILRQSTRFVFGIPFFENYAASSDLSAPEVAITNIQVVVDEPPLAFLAKLKQALKNRP